MIKRIITFVVCLALCVSCIAVGVVNQKAKDSSVEATADGAIEGISAAPEGATQVGGELYKKDEVYYLNGNVTITRENAATNPTYLALQELLDVKAVEGEYSVPETAVVFDGNANTITTEIPLFNVIGNCTIKNLTIVADNDVTDATVDPIQLEDGDIKMYVENYYSVGTVAASVKGVVTLEDITLNGGLDYSGDDTSLAVLSMGGFVGARRNAGNQAKVTFRNCINNATLNLAPGTNATGTQDNAYRLAVGGFIGMAYGNYGAPYFYGCTNNGDITLTDSHNLATFAAGFCATSYRGESRCYYSVNTGDITVNTGENSSLFSRAGGFVGRTNNGRYEYLINAGNITINSNCDSFESCNARAGGLVAGIESCSKNTTVISSINAGDITFNVAYNNPAGGLVGYTGNLGTYSDLINIGRVETKASGTGSCAYIIGHTTGATFTQSNNYYLAAENAVNSGCIVPSNPYGNKGATLTANEITAALFSTGAGTALDNRVCFETNVNKNLYDILESIINALKTNEVNVDFEFGAIITLSAYLDSTKGEGKFISEFTHEAFTTYLAEHKATNAKLENIDSLYMSTGTRALDENDLVEDKYCVKITLNGANAEYDYTARAFIKIGDAYFYSLSN